MRRRQFITLLGGAAAAWPAAVHAQQSMPVVGFLVGASRDGYAQLMASLRQGLNETDFAEGRNVAFEFRWADNEYDRLPELAADLIRRQPAAIFVTGGVVSAIAAKAATKTIPIVFAQGSDPVQYGLVASLNRPGGNVTGVTFYNTALGPKRIELLRELVPNAGAIAVLVNPDNPSTRSDSEQIQEAGRTIGVRVEIVPVRSERGLDDAFAKIAQLRADALMVHVDALFLARRDKLAALAAHHRLPAIYPQREFAAAGGLISYGANSPDVYRQAGIYVGRILKGAKPADLPVLQPTKFELVVNVKAANALGLVVPWFLQQRADEVIE
jgi:putative tryptophan/tyrosine transport system substrate-binding protein